MSVVEGWTGTAAVPGSGTRWILRDPDAAPDDLAAYGTVTITGVQMGDESADPASAGRGRELVLQPVEFNGAPAITAAFDLFTEFYVPATPSAVADIDAALDALMEAAR